MKYLGLLLLNLFGYCVVHSQSGEIRGITFDSIITNRIQYAKVWLDDGKIGTASDSNGIYVISKIPFGNYTFHAYELGYYDYCLENVKIQADSVININVPFANSYLTLGGSALCPTCHKSDQLIPIVYGKPTKKTVRMASEDKVKLAGCMIPACAKKTFCKRDNTEF
jgi:hypothetical protein